MIDICKIIQNQKSYDAFLSVTADLFEQAFKEGKEEVLCITPYGEMILKTPQLKKKKLVYQWVCKTRNGEFYIPQTYFHSLGDLLKKELSPISCITESEKEIEV
jgi:hypothetical protein